MQNYGAVDSSFGICNTCELYKDSVNNCKICNILICKDCTVFYSRCFKKSILCKTCYKTSYKEYSLFQTLRTRLFN